VLVIALHYNLVREVKGQRTYRNGTKLEEKNCDKKGDFLPINVYKIEMIAD
jgi:hypothetical protein